MSHRVIVTAQSWEYLAAFVAFLAFLVMAAWMPAATIFDDFGTTAFSIMDKFFALGLRA